MAIAPIRAVNMFFISIFCVLKVNAFCCEIITNVYSIFVTIPLAVAADQQQTRDERN